MNILFLRRVGPALMAVALLWLSLAGIAHSQDSTGTTLELHLPPEGAVGQEMKVEARLTDQAGEAVVDVEVVFQREVEFMNSFSVLELGRATTNEQGVATLSLIARSEGEMQIMAQFPGNGQHGPASSDAAVPVQTGPLLYVEEAGVRVPGINVSLLVGILGGVWGTYFVVMALIFLIAREGGPPPASEVSYE